MDKDKLKYTYLVFGFGFCISASDERRFFFAKVDDLMGSKNKV